MDRKGNGENIFDKIRDDKSANWTDMGKNCFEDLDKDRDGGLDLIEFTSMSRLLFCNENGQPYAVSSHKIEQLFHIFDKNHDGIIDYEEFTCCFNNWIKQILFPVNALLIIDVQNDFISGTLAVRNCPAKQEGLEVVPVINHMIINVPFQVVIYSLDWHPPNHVSFYENVKNRKIHASSKVTADAAKIFDTITVEGPPVTDQRLWPAHCIQESWGAELHPDLKYVNEAIIIKKGSHPDIDSYSAFWDNNRQSTTTLRQELEAKNVTNVYVCGLAYDICVGATASDALDIGFRTVVVDDACRGVDLDDIQKVKNQLIKNHAIIVNSAQVKAMVLARDRRFELGYKAALNSARSDT
ncbi:hypothetical protein CHUAL_004233 [Chamberlinius hualienensis]